MARNKYPEETKNLIIETAARLFIEKGYENTSIQDIIDNLGGLSKGAIYHHFKSKEVIMNEVTNRLYAGAENRLREICKRKDLNGLEKVKMIMQGSMFEPAQNELFAAAPDMMKNPQMLVMYLQDTVQGEALDEFVPVIEEGIADGSIQTDYPRELAEVILILGNIWVNPMIYHCDIEESINKMRFFQHMMRLFGIDIITDEMVERMEKLAKIYQESK